jgi:2-oxoglutarate ferredoxin oxidoreductase subunit gamma
MTNTQEAIVFAGFGGQGVMFVGQLLCYAAMDEGYHVTWIPSYGPEMRGGTANCFVVVSKHPIGSPLARHPGIVVAFNQPSMDKFAATIAPGGLLIINGSLIKETTSRVDIEAQVIPATDIASRLGDLRLTNIVLLGAMLAARPILSLATVEHALEDHLPVHRRNLLEANFQALEQGAMWSMSKFARQSVLTTKAVS